jgi:hypothetical protein
MRTAIKKTTFLAALVLLVIPVLASAQCTDIFENLEDNSEYWFGLRHDGANLASAQSFTLDCDARIEEVRFFLKLTSSGGVPALQQGDAIDAVIMDMSANVLATAQTTVTHASGTDWVIVDFTGDTTIYPAGQYMVAMGTTVERMGAMRKNTNDPFAGGATYASTDGIGGDWSPFSTQDLVFRVTADTDISPAAEASWSAVKKQFD